MKTQPSHRLGRLRVYEDDPYNGHRSYIVACREQGEVTTATLACAAGEGEVEHIQLTPAECRWLNQLEDTLPYDL